ncbi:MAG: hypothetical protein ACT7A5_10500, partial [Ferrovibrionaceae bacterium]
MTTDTGGIAQALETAEQRLAEALSRLETAMRERDGRSAGEVEALKSELAATALGMARGVADVKTLKEQLAQAEEGAEAAKSEAATALGLAEKLEAELAAARAEAAELSAALA